MTQPPVEQPQPPYGPGGDHPPALPPVAPVKRVNAFAVTGIVLGLLIWPLGLLFSIIGLVKSKARAGSGKALSIVGIVVSLVGAASFIGFAVEVSHLLKGDPGCIAAENDSTAMMNTFSTDINAIIYDEGTSAERAAVQHFIGHVQALRSELTVAAAKAQHQPVRAKIAIMTSDLDTMTSGLQAVLHGDTSQISPVIIASTAETKETTSLLSLCPSSALLSVAHTAACSCLRLETGPVSGCALTRTSCGWLASQNSGAAVDGRRDPKRSRPPLFDDARGVSRIDEP